MVSSLTSALVISLISLLWCFLSWVSLKIGLGRGLSTATSCHIHFSFAFNLCDRTHLSCLCIFRISPAQRLVLCLCFSTVSDRYYSPAPCWTHPSFLCLHRFTIFLFNRSCCPFMVTSNLFRMAGTSGLIFLQFLDISDYLSSFSLLTIVLRSFFAKIHTSITRRIVPKFMGYGMCSVNREWWRLSIKG